MKIKQQIDIQAMYDRKVNGKVEAPSAEMSDAELRKAIKQATGKKAGPRTRRKELLAQYKKLQKDG